MSASAAAAQKVCHECRKYETNVYLCGKSKKEIAVAEVFRRHYFESKYMERIGDMTLYTLEDVKDELIVEVGTLDLGAAGKVALW